MKSGVCFRTWPLSDTHRFEYLFQVGVGIGRKCQPLRPPIIVVKTQNIKFPTFYGFKYYLVPLWMMFVKIKTYQTFQQSEKICPRDKVPASLNDIFLYTCNNNNGGGK